MRNYSANLTIIKSRDDIDLSQQQLEILKDVLAYFNGRLDETVHVAQTIHGHIAEIKFREEHVIPYSEARPLRMDREDFKFWLEKNIRWLEAAGDCITIGL